MTQEEFEKLLQKKCPWHPGANHAAIDWYHLRTIFSHSGGGKKNKPVDKEHEDDNQEDKSHNVKFQYASKTVNVIFGGDGDFSSRRDQKLLL
jgi:carbonic anhydrase